MKYRSKYLGVALVLVMVLLAACAKEPTQEVSGAQAAIAAAMANDGEKYAKDDVKKLNDDLTAARDEVQTQQKKFFKNYDKAKEILAKVKADAEALNAEIPARKEKVKNEAIAALDAAKTAVADAKALLEKAPRGKGTAADIEALRADVTGMEESLKEADGLMVSEDHFAVIDKATSIKDKAAAVSTQINDAIAKKGMM